MRAVLDSNVLIASVLSPTGAPGRLVDEWRRSSWELVVSETLLEETDEVLSRPRIRSRVEPDEAGAFIKLLRTTATVVADPTDVPKRASDPDDDYLLALAERAGALLVSGDRHLLALQDRFPIHSPRAFLDLLEADLAR